MRHNIKLTDARNEVSVSDCYRIVPTCSQRCVAFSKGAQASKKKPLKQSGFFTLLTIFASATRRRFFSLQSQTIFTTLNCNFVTTNSKIK